MLHSVNLPGSFISRPPRVKEPGNEVDIGLGLVNNSFPFRSDPRSFFYMQAGTNIEDDIASVSFHCMSRMPVMKLVLV